MLIPIRCITCGYPIGRVAAVFQMIRSHRVGKYLKKGNAPTQALVDANLKIDMSDVFERLGIPLTADCCRTHLATGMDIRHYY